MYEYNLRWLTHAVSGLNPARYVTETFTTKAEYDTKLEWLIVTGRGFRSERMDVTA